MSRTGTLVRRMMGQGVLDDHVKPSRQTLIDKVVAAHPGVAEGCQRHGRSGGG